MGNFSQSGLQNLVQCFVQNSVQRIMRNAVQMLIGESRAQPFAAVCADARAVVRADACAEKSGSDADAFAEEMQKRGSKLYEYSTRLDADKHGCSGLARIIPAAEGAGLIRMNPPNPPNSRSILVLQKNGRDAEHCAVVRADAYAEHRAEVCADVRAVISAETVQNFVQVKFILSRATGI